ncbi:unnamed protein product, partial [Polarella glacialis]
VPSRETLHTAERQPPPRPLPPSVLREYGVVPYPSEDRQGSNIRTATPPTQIEAAMVTGCSSSHGHRFLSPDRIHRASAPTQGASRVSAQVWPGKAASCNVPATCHAPAMSEYVRSSSSTPVMVVRQQPRRVSAPPPTTAQRCMAYATPTEPVTIVDAPPPVSRTAVQ